MSHPTPTPAAAGAAVCPDQPFVVLGRELEFEKDSPFWRAVAAVERADEKAAFSAVRVADAVVGGYLDTCDYELDTYRRVKASRVYADAVYQVEVAKVRAR